MQVAQVRESIMISFSHNSLVEMTLNRLVQQVIMKILT